MSKLTVTEFITLDGVVQAPGGSEDTDGGFTEGGWTRAFEHPDIERYLVDAIAGASSWLVGRKTWEIHGGAFDPMEGDDFADMVNAMPKYVVSRTLTDTSLWRNSTVISGDVAARVRELKAREGKPIYVDGSSALVHTLAANDLVDEWNLLLYPVSLGGGKKLFPDDVRINLKLVESRPFPTGVVLMRYEPERTE